MAHNFKITRYLEDGTIADQKRVCITADDELIVTPAYEHIPQPRDDPSNELDWTDLVDSSSCYVEHHLNLDEYVGDLKREAMSIRMRASNRKPGRTQKEIARLDQLYALGLLDWNPEFQKRDTQHEEGKNNFPVMYNIPTTSTLNVSKQETTEDFDLENVMVMLSTPPHNVAGSSASSEYVPDKENKSVRGSTKGKKGKKSKEHQSKNQVVPMELDTDAEEFASMIEQVKREESDCGDFISEYLLQQSNEEVQDHQSRAPSVSRIFTNTPVVSKQEEHVYRCLSCGRVFADRKQIEDHVLDKHTTKEEIVVLAALKKENHDGTDEDSASVILLDEDEEEKIYLGDDLAKMIQDENCEALKCKADLMKRHTEEVQACSLLQCEFCESVFMDTNTLLAHTHLHRAEKNYECLSCSRDFTSHGQAIAHWQAECYFTRGVKTFTLHKFLACNVCERKFIGWDQLYNHRYKNRHLMLKSYGPEDLKVHQCDQCLHLSTTYAALMDHRAKAHPRSLRAAEIAKRNHGQRSFLCEICGKAYTQSSHLWQHLRFHQGIKPFACTEPGCGRKFTIRPDLNDHIRKSHTGERPFHCTECDKRFLTGSVYYQHRLIHRGDRRYACQQCDKRFYRADALKNHARIHSGEKPYRCPVCDRCFRQRGDRDKHLKVRHGHNDDDGMMLNGGNESPGQMEQHMYIRNINPFPVELFHCIEPMEQIPDLF